jgi:hypothetical protein
MRTEIKTSLTGQTVHVEGLVLDRVATLPQFEAEVVSTWFSISGTVEAVEIIHPTVGRRLQVWEGFATQVCGKCQRVDCICPPPGSTGK